MSTNAPGTRTGRPKTERLLQIARQILAILTEYHPQSVRHIFYRLLDPTLPTPVDKTEAGYKCVQRVLVALRRTGRVRAPGRCLRLSRRPVVAGRYLYLR